MINRLILLLMVMAEALRDRQVLLIVLLIIVQVEHRLLEEFVVILLEKVEALELEEQEEVLEDLEVVEDGLEVLVGTDALIPVVVQRTIALGLQGEVLDFLLLVSLMDACIVIIQHLLQMRQQPKQYRHRMYQKLQHQVMQNKAMEE